MVPDSRIALLRPAFSFLLVNSQVEDIRPFLLDVIGSGAFHLFISFLDAKQTHWSLLVVSLAKRLVLHYTSMPAPHGN